MNAHLSPQQRAQLFVGARVSTRHSRIAGLPENQWPRQFGVIIEDYSDLLEDTAHTSAIRPIRRFSSRPTPLESSDVVVSCHDVMPLHISTHLAHCHVVDQETEASTASRPEINCSVVRRMCSSVRRAAVSPSRAIEASMISRCSRAMSRWVRSFAGRVQHRYTTEIERSRSAVSTR